MDVCSPFQYALSTRAGAEALARALSVSCELNPSNTVVCVDGVGAYDHIARAAMFEGLRRGARLASLMPFVRQVYGRESTYIFYDNRTRATSLPGAGLPCSQQHAMLQTSPALPQQPMPTMMTLRASDAGRPPARTSAEEKCPEAGPCSQRRLWLRALKTPSQHCLTPARRPPAQLTEIPADVRDLQPDAPATLTDAAVGQALRSSRRGTAAGLSGATCEHYKVLLDDAEALELFAHAANLLASAQNPR